MTPSERLQLLLENIVSHPDSVGIEVSEMRSQTVFNVRVHDGDFGRVIGQGGKTIVAIKEVIAKTMPGRKIAVCVSQPSTPDKIKPAMFMPAKIWQSRKTREMVDLLNDLFGKPFNSEFIGKDVGNNTLVDILWKNGRTEQDHETLVRLIASIGKKRGRYVVIGG
jgi:predicted RNA-binding protein YlqC (UPF0109 family)